MKAIQLVKYGNAREAFKMNEVSIPGYNDNQVLIKVESFGLNFADVMARRGLYKAAPPLPCILGYEAVGTVEKMGNKNSGFDIGNRVVAFTRFGGYAEYVVADSRAVVKIDSDVGNGTAVALSTQYCTAYYAAYDMANIREGETVLIHAAAGGVGIALIQLAQRKNCRIIGTVGSDEKVKFIESLGVDWAINYRKNDFADEVGRLVPGGKVDVVFDPVGGQSFKKGRRILNVGGRIVGYGASDQLNRKQGPMSKIQLLFGFGFMNPVSVLVQSQGILGVNMLKVADYRPEIIQRTLKSVLYLLKKHEIEPYVGKEYHANDIHAAHEFFESRQSIGKIVMHW